MLSQTIALMPGDAWIVHALNAWVGSAPRFDNILHLLNGNPLLKGIPFVTLLWWLGGQERQNGAYEVGFLARSLGGLLCALVVARILQNHGPEHLRPISDPTLGLRAFMENDPNYFQKLNSFPSDHAVIFFALSLAIFARRAKIGLAAFAWSFFFICLPRVYFGYHYPSDILAGAALGVAIMAAFIYVPVPSFIGRKIERFSELYPGIPHGAMFVVSAESAVNFDHLRDLLVAFGLR